MADDPEVTKRVTRFWMSVDRSAGDDACWPWTAYADEAGYGYFYDGDRMRPAHEMALTYATGEVRLERLDTCHACNNPPCCNPSHLRFDSRRSNVADMMAAGTHVTTRKMSDDDVLLIRERAAAGATGRTLAQQYGVSEGHLTEIIRGRRRSGVGGPIRTTHGNRKGPDSGRE